MTLSVMVVPSLFGPSLPMGINAPSVSSIEAVMTSRQLRCRYRLCKAGAERPHWTYEYQ